MPKLIAARCGKTVAVHDAFSAAVGNDRREPIAAFVSHVAAENWARTMARDFRRSYVVAEYAVPGGYTPAVIEPPVVVAGVGASASANVNGQLPPLQPGSRHADKTKRPAPRKQSRRQDGDPLEPRNID